MDISGGISTLNIKDIPKIIREKEWINSPRLYGA
jgi:hypothetical protein